MLAHVGVFNEGNINLYVVLNVSDSSQSSNWAYSLFLALFIVVDGILWAESVKTCFLSNGITSSPNENYLLQFVSMRDSKG